MPEESNIITEEDLANQPPVVYPEDPTCNNRWGHRESKSQRINDQLWCIDCAYNFGLLEKPASEEPPSNPPE